MIGAGQVWSAKVTRGTRTPGTVVTAKKKCETKKMVYGSVCNLAKISYGVPVNAAGFFHEV